VAHADKFPINGQVMNFFAMFSASVVYVTVSLCTCKVDFNMDRMLHRGKYAIEGDVSPASSSRKLHWGAVLGFDSEFTRGDKVIAGSLFCWNMFWFLVFAVMTLWYLINPWPLNVWVAYWHIYSIVLPLLLGVVTTIWLTWGGTRDLLRLFKTLGNLKRNPLDDGSVVNHHNLGEPEPPSGSPHLRD
jgi:SSS family solute:Na+ symporter